MFQEVDHGPVAEARFSGREDRGVDPDIPQQDLWIASEVVHQVRKETQHVGMDEVETRLVPAAMFPNRRHLHWIPLEPAKHRWRRSVAHAHYTVSISRVQTVGLWREQKSLIIV